VDCVEVPTVNAGELDGVTLVESEGVARLGSNIYTDHVESGVGVASGGPALAAEQV